AEGWGRFLWTHTADSAWMFLLVAFVWIVLRQKAPAQFGYCLFLLVLFKAVLPYQQPAPIPALSKFSMNYDMIRFYENAVQQTVPQPKTENSFRPQTQEKPSSPSSPPLSVVKATQTAPRKSPGKSLSKTDISPKFINENQPSLLQAKTKETIVSSSDNRTIVSNEYPIPPLNLASILMLVWLAITFALSLRLIYTEWRIAKLVNNSCPLDPSEFPQSFPALLSQSRVKRRVRFLANSTIHSPLVCGIASPILLLPEDFFEKYSGGQARWILLHELAHIRRWDPLIRLFQEIVQILYFFHPAVWIANRFIDRLREFACDDEAIVVSNLPRYDCGESFLRVVFHSNRVQLPAPGFIGLNQSKQIVKERLMRILDQKRILHLRLPSRLMAPLVGLALVFLPFSGFVKAEESALSPNAAEVKPVAPVAVQPAADQTFPTDGFQKGSGQYVWKRAVEASADKLTSAEYATPDGDIVIKPQTDPKLFGVVYVDAVIIIKSQNPLQSLSEEEILKIKEKVDVVIERDKEGKTLVVRGVQPQKPPKGVGITINLTIKTPSSLSTRAVGSDGDIAIEGIKAAVEARTSDGDLEIKNCEGSINVTTSDGDLALSDCAGEISAVSSDGDVVLSGCAGSITARTSDGDIVMESFKGPIQAVTSDGDIILTHVSAQAAAKTNDGDLEAEFDAAPENDCDFHTQGGSISVVLPSDSKLTLDIQCGDGEIELDKSKFEGTVTEHQAQGTLNGGGPKFQARSGDGDITITSK
ncbi:MAG: M56 family metallopeptidase, partial [Candidatus Omnitrophota bacterium]